MAKTLCGKCSATSMSVTLFNVYAIKADLVFTVCGDTIV
jgi:hypothetical protein